MELKNMTKEEIELMSYTDLTYMILKENKKSMNTAELFKKICDLLELGEDEFSTKIGDYYTSLTIDKRFVLLNSAEWDLKQNHAIPMDLDDEEESEDEEEIIDEEESEEDEIEEEEEEDDIDSIDDTDDLDLDDDDDIDDLAIIDEDDEELEKS